MTVIDKINVGRYRNQVPYTVFEKDQDKRDEMHKAYRDEERRLHDLFYRDCCDDLGLDPTKKSSEKLFEKAYDDGHAYGYSEVYSHMVDLNNFINEMMALRLKEGSYYPSAD